jgi:hypothetical protein
MIKFLFLLFLITNLYGQDKVEFKGLINDLENDLVSEFKLETIGDELMLKLTPRGALNSCHFKVSEINLPRPYQLASRGHIHSQRGECLFKFEPSERVKVWNDIKLVDFNFSISEALEIQGTVVLHQLDKSYYVKFSIKKD